MPVAVCKSREAVFEMIRGIDPHTILNGYNVISLLDTGLSSPFHFSIYQKDAGVDSRYADWRPGHHPNLITFHTDDRHQGNYDKHKELFGGDPWHYADFTYSQARRFLAWYVSRKEENDLPFMAHCYAGRSRSAAFAWWITKREGFSWDDFLFINPQAKPNKNILHVLNVASDYDPIRRETT